MGCLEGSRVRSRRHDRLHSRSNDRRSHDRGGHNRRSRVHGRRIDWRRVVGRVVAPVPERPGHVAGREAAEAPTPAASPAAVVSAMVPAATMAPAAVVPPAAVVAAEGVVTAAETATTWTRAETCRRHAHACNCGNRRNENLVDLHVITSFFWVYDWLGTNVRAV